MNKDLGNVISNKFSQEETKLLTIISRFIKTNRSASYSNIESLIGIKIPSIINNWEEIADSLENKKVIITSYDNDEKTFGLSEEGNLYSDFVFENGYLTRYFYDEYYKRAEKSEAHKEFCETVYGKNLCQHGMADMEQIHMLIENSDIDNKSKVLEIGCGNGAITEYISDITGANITGVDISSLSIETAIDRTKEKKDRLKFEAINISDLSFKENTFDSIIAIDSLFFINPFDDVVENLVKMLKPNGKMGVFYIYPPNSEELRFNNELNRLGLKYSVIDLSKENSNHWIKKEECLTKLKSRFEEENNMFLYNNRMEECKSNIGKFKRYLYTVNI